MTLEELGIIQQLLTGNKTLSDFQGKPQAQAQSYDTTLTPDEEAQFQTWKAQNAPKDSGMDYDLRGAFKAGVQPDPTNGHWPDTYKKPNHPTFSDQSQYAKGVDAAKAGHWDGETYTPAGQKQDLAAPYNDQAAKYNTEADSLEKDMATPYPQPHGVKENIISGIRSGMQDFGRLGVPGGSTGQEMLRQKQFNEENAMRLDRVKSLRSGAAQQQQMGQTKVFQTGELENQTRNAGINQQNADRLQEIANRPVRVNETTGSVSQAVDPRTQMPIPQTEIKGPDRPDITKNYQYRDAIAENGHTIRTYFDHDPQNIVGNEDLGIKAASGSGAGGGLQMAQITLNGQPVVGGYNRKDNTISPATLKGDNTGAPVQNATAGNAGARAGVAATVDVATADKMLTVMQDTFNRLQSGSSQAPGADDMVLLSNHIAMTFGGVKGARTGRDMIEAHLKARSLPEALAATAERVLSGGQLTPGQRQEFLNLAKSNVAALHQKQMDLQDSFGGAPSTPAAGGGFIKPGGALESLLKGH